MKSFLKIPFFKKLLAGVVVLASAVSLISLNGRTAVFADDAMVAGKIYLEENFDGVAEGKLPKGWKKSATLSNSGSAGVSDGRLIIDCGSSVEFGKVLLPDLPEITGDYMIEADIEFLSSRDESRWMSLVVRQQSSDQDYLHMCVRRNTAAANGVELAVRSSPGEWNILTKGGAKKNIGLNNTAHVKMCVAGDIVFEYINDELVISSDALGSLRGFYKTGGLAIQANFCKLAVDNVKVSSCEFVADPAAGDANYMPYDLLDTKVIAPAATVCEPASLQELDRYINLEQRPENVILYVSDSLDVTSPDGGQNIGALSDVYPKISRVMVPVFYVKTSHAAEKLAEFLSKNKIVDCLFMSADSEILKTLRSSRKKSGAILDRTEFDLPAFSAEYFDELIYAANTCGTKTVLISEKIAEKEWVEYVQHRLITVWVRETADVPVMLHNSIQSGANGIVTDTPEDLIDAYSFYSGEIGVLVRNPLVIGHRGLPSKAPENSIESAKEAVAAGADCIELDVRLSKDGELYIYHDDDLSSLTTGSGTVNSRTSAELNKYKLLRSSGYGTFDKYPSVAVPTLRAFFEALKDDDVMFFIEIKESAGGITEKVCAMVEEFGLKNRCCMITFVQSQIPVFQKNLPGVSTGELMATPAGSHYTNIVNKVISEILPRNSTFNSSGLYSERVIRSLMYRGVTCWPWTFNKASTKNAYLLGVGGITTDTADEAGDIPVAIDLKNSSFDQLSNMALPEGNAIVFHPEILTRLGTSPVSGKYADGKKIEAPEIVVLDGAEFIKVSGAKVIGVTPGTAHLMYRFRTSTDPKNSPTEATGFTLYSQVLTVTVVNANDPDNTPDPSGTPSPFVPQPASKAPDLLPLWIILGCVALAGASVAVVIVLKKRRSKR